MRCRRNWRRIYAKWSMRPALMKMTTPAAKKMTTMKSQTYEAVPHDVASAMEPVTRGMVIQDRQELVGRARGPVEDRTSTSSWS
jgi:hypothetical protein